MRGNKKVERNKTLHILLTDDEKRRLNIVVADTGKRTAAVLRPLIMDFVDRELKERGLRITLNDKK
jgi:predicted transcriptional regulator